MPHVILCLRDNSNKGAAVLLLCIFRSVCVFSGVYSCSFYTTLNEIHVIKLNQILFSVEFWTFKHFWITMKNKVAPIVVQCSGTWICHVSWRSVTITLTFLWFFWSIQSYNRDSSIQADFLPRQIVQESTSEKNSSNRFRYFLSNT